MRWPSLVAGAISIAIAFYAATQVADTREGLLYEVVTLFASLVGVILIMFGLFDRALRSRRPHSRPLPRPSPPPEVHFASELVLGSGGLLVAVLLLAGLAASVGPLWGLLGLVLLLPMIAGSAYLCFRFIRGPKRKWRIDFGRLTGRR